MADKKISQLTSATTPLAGTEILPIVQGGNTVKVSVDNLTAGKAVTASQLTIENNSSSNAVRITQTGSGNALVVEDSSNPDATPFVIDSSGNVLVGTTTANGIFSAVGDQISVGAGAGSGSLGIQIKGTALSAIPAAQVQAYIATGNSSIGVAGDLLIASRTDVAANIRFITGTTPVERMKIAATGDISAVTGNLVIGTAAKGIDFSANTHAAGMTSELLNDYEEGTWTPTVSSSVGTITSVTATGKYTKIGRQVTIEISLSVTNNGTGSDSIRIGGLPYTAESTAYAGSGFNTSSGETSAVGFAATNTLVVYKYNATYPVTTGQGLAIVVTYFV